MEVRCVLNSSNKQLNIFTPQLYIIRDERIQLKWSLINLISRMFNFQFEASKALSRILILIRFTRWKSLSNDGQLVYYFLPFPRLPNRAAQHKQRRKLIITLESLACATWLLTRCNFPPKKKSSARFENNWKSFRFLRKSKTASGTWAPLGLANN